MCYSLNQTFTIYRNPGGREGPSVSIPEKIDVPSDLAPEVPRVLLLVSCLRPFLFDKNGPYLLVLNHDKENYKLYVDTPSFMMIGVKLLPLFV